MHTFIKSLSATKIPKKEEPLNNDQLSFWQQLVTTTKKNERENVENFFKMFKNSPNRNDILEPVDFEDEFNHERDLMKELAFLNVETQSNKSAKSDEDLFASKFFESLLQRSQENITNSTNDSEQSDKGFEPENSDNNSEFVEESDSGEQKSETPVIGENLEPDGGPPNYLELEPPPIDTIKEVAPEENELKVNDEEFLASLQQETNSRGTWQNRKQQTNPEVEINENLYRSRIENLLFQHDEAKLKHLDYLLAQHEDSQRLYVHLCNVYKVEPILNNLNVPELGCEKRTASPPLLKQDPTKCNPSTPFET